MTESLPLEQVRKLVLLSQRLPPTKQTGRAIDATLDAITHLGYVQIDTISVIQRAHHHVLWTRNPRYQTGHLDHLVEEGSIFEYWSHAAAFLPMSDYRFSLMRKNAIKIGKLEHWYEPDEKLMAKVLKRIQVEGPLLARDFEAGDSKAGQWHHKPAKRALENLFMRGDLMVSRRENFHKVYDLTHRVLPSGIDTSVPNQEEYGRFLVNRYLQANGLGQAAEMAYLLKNTKGLITNTLLDMIENRELLQIKVANDNYVALPGSLELLGKPLARSKLKILSPFDNLLIQRKRAQALFGFTYLLECYVPRSKRKNGYFSLPILWDGNLVARLDCKADRRNARLQIHELSLEPQLKRRDVFFRALAKELKAFMHFNDCSDLDLDGLKTGPGNLKTWLKAALAQET